MNISLKDWANYKNKLSRISAKAVDELETFVNRIGGYDANINAVIDYALALSTKYGEAAATLACDFYDAVAAAEGAMVPPAVPAETASISDVAKAINATKDYAGNTAANTVGRMVKRTAADTTLKNALRDGAEFAWIPSGDSCVFCMVLASRGWQHISKNALKNGHAEHIHSNCDCQYAVRFDGKSNVAGYDPDKYLEQYRNVEGNTPAEKIRAMRREYYAEHKDEINAQKRALYAREEQEKRSRSNRFTVNRSIIKSVEYTDKFSTLTDNHEVNDRLHKKALDILNHRDGTDYEDMHLISIIDGEVKGSQTKVEYTPGISEELKHKQVWYNKQLHEAIKHNGQGTLISIHNHPESLPPSGGDLESQFFHGYKGGVIVCHNGDIYYYEVGKKRFTGALYDMTVDKYIKLGYSEIEAYKTTLNEFAGRYGMFWRKL